MTNKQTDQTNNKKTPKTTPKTNKQNKKPFNKLQLMKLTPSWEFATKSLFSFCFTNHNSVFAFCECVLHAVIVLCPWILRNIINLVREINTCIFHVHEHQKKKNGTTHGTVQWHLVYHYSTSAMKRAFEKLIQLCYYCCQTILLKESVLYINS